MHGAVKFIGALIVIIKEIPRHAVIYYIFSDIKNVETSGEDALKF